MLSPEVPNTWANTQISLSMPARDVHQYASELLHDNDRMTARLLRFPISRFPFPDSRFPRA
ncbi:hypothetical protein XAXN_19330 [Xanthomonas axonopodis]|uniref:Uncharacterized protein n=2 Tax=Xanthomonas axonopodis TaxID=53413 RepID=A0A0P6VBT7_9XANT|nr:hypothetical protein XAXN_19330 [Xanthomonas axonopodis]